MHGIPRKGITEVFPETGLHVDKLIQALLSTGEIIRFDAVNDIYVHTVYLEKLKGLLVEKVKEFHKINSLSPGISKEHLRTSLQSGVDVKLFSKVLQELIKKGELQESGPNITVRGFSATLGSDHQDLGGKISKILDESGFEPPKVTELTESLHVSQKDLLKILGFLAREGKIVKIKDDLYLSKVHEDALKERVRAFILKNQSMAPADMKTIVGASRKYAIPYMEYLDRLHFTMRIGDVRKLSSAK
jgi:selenocysteine-specific elongation factor